MEPTTFVEQEQVANNNNDIDNMIDQETHPSEQLNNEQKVNENKEIKRTNKSWTLSELQYLNFKYNMSVCFCLIFTFVTFVQVFLSCLVLMFRFYTFDFLC